MKTLLTTILFALIAVTGWGQTKNPLVYYKLDGNFRDTSGNGYHAIARGLVDHDAVYKVSDGYSIDLDGNNEYLVTPTMDLGTHFAVSFWARSILDIGTDSRVLVHMGSPTTYWRIYIYENKLRVGSTGSNNAYNGTWTKEDWHHIVVEINNATARIFIDGSRSTAQVDSSISTTIPTNDSLYIGVGASLSADFYGNIDELMIFKDLEVSSSVLDSLYTMKCLGDPGESYFPVPGRDLRFYKNGIEKKDKPDELGFIYWRKKYITPSPDDPLLNILFADDLEEWTIGPIPIDTVMYKWQAMLTNFHSSNQSIIDLGSNKVWKSQYLDGEYGSAYGLGFATLLSDTVHEIWTQVDLYFVNPWSGTSSLNYHSGKILAGGAFGGYHFGNPESQSVDSSGTSPTSKGWTVHSGWGGGSPNRLFMYTYDQAGWNYQEYFGYSHNGVWKTYTTHIKMNTPGKADGLRERYVDGVLVAQDTTGIYWSLSQYQNGLNGIEGAVWRYMFGGTGINYISVGDNIIYFDNLVVFSPTNHPDFPSGKQAIGSTVPILEDVEDTYQEQILFDETFYLLSDTIKSHYNHGTYPPYSQDTIIKTIDVNETIYLIFMSWFDGYDGHGYPTNGETKSNMQVKIYSGNDVTPTFWFNEAYSTLDTAHGVPIVGNVYEIEGPVTIEYFPGKDMNHGWSLRYYTP